MRKYHNKKIEYEGMTFDSKKELKYWLHFKEMEKAGLITNLQRQVEFELIPRQTTETGKFLYHPIKYVADMTYYKDGVYTVVDIKSTMTRKLPDYIMKKKLLYYIHHIILTEIL